MLSPVLHKRRSREPRLPCLTLDPVEILDRGKTDLGDLAFPSSIEKSTASMRPAANPHDALFFEAVIARVGIALDVTFVVGEKLLGEAAASTL